ncbi:DUF3549 family protein [Aliidiomarina celeris]|uniref:DUF3549 family protein n=1 Tax=Aliidiomarina celeris TaxID=2249428 RepID=UPI000DEAF723|nr:DUF3549 family protein [Aliidiomarina celeris]
MTISTLSEFMQASGVEWHVYDVSRRVCALPLETLKAIEQGSQPFPYPRQQKAWLGITFWQPTQADNPFIWFVSLPLDERGAFQHAAMQHFLSIIVDALGATPTAEPDQQQAERLQQNPYIFQPDEPRRAMFHALVSHDLNRSPSIHFEHAHSFLSGHPMEWQQVGVQGIYDVMLRCLHEPAIQQHVHTQFQFWPAPVRDTVVAACEHLQLPSALQANLLAQVSEQTATEQPELVIALLRATSGRHAERSYRQKIKLLTRKANSELQLNLITLIAARSWLVLEHPELMHWFFAAAAAHNPQLFVQLFRELVFLPQLRLACLTYIRQQHTDTTVQQAIAQLVKSAGARS